MIALGIAPNDAFLVGEIAFQVLRIELNEPIVAEMLPLQRTLGRRAQFVGIGDPEVVNLLSGRHDRLLCQCGGSHDQSQ